MTRAANMSDESKNCSSGSGMGKKCFGLWAKIGSVTVVQRMTDSPMKIRFLPFALDKTAGERSCPTKIPMRTRRLLCRCLDIKIMVIRGNYRLLYMSIDFNQSIDRT